MNNKTKKALANQALKDAEKSETPVIPLNKNATVLSKFEQVENYLAVKYEFRLNTISNEVEYRLKHELKVEFQPLNENNIYRELQKANISFSKNNLISLFSSDFVKKYDPFQSYFENLPEWNKAGNEPDYIYNLTNYIPVKEEDKERFRIQFKKMLVRSVACALGGSFNKQAFILVHSMQNSGKSTFCRWLCPPALENYKTENISLDKDSLIALTSNFIINYDELASLTKTEINQLKAFMSKDVVKVRHPYESKATTKPRRANFVGSTNNDEFLSDSTGSVRWLCFELTGKLNFAYSTEIDINNIWAQAYSLYKSGFKYELTAEEIQQNENANETHRIRTTEQELIQDRFIPGSKGEQASFFASATRIKTILEAENSGTRINPINIGKALKVLGFKQEQEHNGTYQVKGYYFKNK